MRPFDLLKCHLIIANKQISVNINIEVIHSSNSAELLGTGIDNKLNFNDHASYLCHKTTKTTAMTI